MVKTFRLNNLDCANCAAKMENAIRKLDGVNDISVVFMTQKMVLDADDAHFDEILKKVVKLCRRVEPDMEILM